MKYEIRNRFSGAVQFTADIDCAEDAAISAKIGLAVKWAIEARADLAGADLAGANLAGANLAGANLAYANLAYANLTRAYLTDADLTRANLADADLTRANLAYANLAYANLTRAYLTDANLTDADLTRAYLTRANLAYANLAHANLTDADLAYANLIDGGQRSDGYRFVGWIRDGRLIIRAGCRNFDLEQARAHWAAAEYRDRRLGDEALAILDHIERVAAIRGLVRHPKATGEAPR